MERDHLRDLLLRHLEASTVPHERLLDVLLAMGGSDALAAPSRWELLRALDGREGESFERLRQALRAALVNDLWSGRGSQAGPENRSAGWPADVPPCHATLPVGWQTGEGTTPAFERLADAEADLALVLEREVSEVLARRVERERNDAWGALTSELGIGAFVSIHELLERLPEHPVRERVRAFVADHAGEQGFDPRADLERFRDDVLAAPHRDEATACLDRLLAWPTMLAAPQVLALCEEPWRRDRAHLILHLRFGAAWTPEHDVLAWLERCVADLEARERMVRAAVIGREVFALACWFQPHRERDPELALEIETWMRTTLAPRRVSSFLERWGRRVPREDRLQLHGVERAAEMRARKEPRVVPPKPRPEPRVRREPFWRPHLRAFFAENWFLVAGILMVVAGASLVAYFTWDEHWLVRYSAIPGLLLGFTFLIARLATFLERRGELVANAALLLRGAAVLLLPVNAIVVSILARDSSVPSKTIVVPAMAVAYLALFLVALRRWTRVLALPRNVGLAGALTFLVALPLVRPVAALGIDGDVHTWRIVLAITAYAALAVAGCSGLRYLWRAMDADQVRAVRVPRFVIGTLLLTLVQTLAWSYGTAHVWPRWHVLAPWLALLGALLLNVQRRALDLTERDRGHDGEAFAGYACFGFALLGAAIEPWMRAVTLAIVGVAWFHHGLQRERWNVQRWIGGTLLAMLGVAIALLPEVAWEARPWILLGWSIAYALLSRSFAGGERRTRAGGVLRALVVPLLIGTVCVAIVTQWKTQSPPWHTAVLLIVVTMWTAMRAWQAQDTSGLVTTSALAALALPYLGCVDLSARTWHGNTMVFGLAVLSWVWIAWTLRARADFVRGARSTVLWIYGVLAFFGMLARATLEPVTPGDLEAFRLFATMTGPVLMAGALVVAAYTSRSLVPGFLAMAILVVLFPELRLRFATELERLGWGAGLGSALSAMSLTGLAFALRAAPFLRMLGAGDRFLGRSAFPWRRHDASLFTFPVTVSVLFLVGRTCTRTYLENLPEPTFAAALAVAISSCVWFLQALYHARRRLAPLLTYVGCIFGLLGLSHLVRCMDVRFLTREPFAVVALFLVIVVAVYALTRMPALRERASTERVFTTPLVHVSASLSVFLSVVVGVLLLAKGLGTHDVTAGVLLSMLVWHAVRTRWAAFGALAFGLAWVWIAGPFAVWHAEPVFHWSIAGLQASLVFLTVGLAVFTALERWKVLDARVVALRDPFVHLGCCAYFGALLAVFVSLPTTDTLPRTLVLLVVATGFLLARAHGTSSLTMLALVVAHVLVLRAVARMEDFPPFTESRWILKAVPGAMLLVALSFMGAWLERRRPHWIVSPRVTFPSEHRWLAGYAWLLVFATLAQRLEQGWFGGSFESDPLWLAAPAPVGAFGARLVLPARKLIFDFQGALVFALVAWRLRRVRLVIFAVTAWFFASLDAFAFLRALSWSQPNLRELHLLASTALATVLPLLVATHWIRAPRVQRHLRRLTALVLVAFVGFHLERLHLPANITGISSASLTFTGVTWCLFAATLWWFERRPIADMRSWTEVTRPVRAVLTWLATYAFAYALPWIGTPQSSSLALFLVPVAWFVWSTFQRREANAEPARFAIVMGSLAWWCTYLAPGLHETLLLAGARPLEDGVHVHAGEAIALGLLWMRLGRLAGRTWMACVGACSLFVGIGFLVTWFPLANAERHPFVMAATWCVLAHAFLLASAWNAPLGRLACALGLRDASSWRSVERGLACFVVLAAHVALVAALASIGSTVWVAPSLALTATVFIHAGWRRRAMVFLALGGLESILALHMDLLVTSWITTDTIVWLLLGAWFAWLVIESFADERRGGVRTRRSLVAGSFFAFCLAHVLHHRPWTAVGLTAFAGSSLFVLLTPCSRSDDQADEKSAIEHLVLLLPVWFVFFFFVGREPHPLATCFWPWTMAGLAALLTAHVARRMASRATSCVRDVSRPRLVHRVLARLERDGLAIANAWTAGLGVAAVVMAIGVGSRTSPERTWLALLALQCGTAYELWKGNVAVRPRTAALAVQGMLLCTLLSLRTFWMQTHPEHWSPEHDVWALLVLSTLVSGCDALWRVRGPRFERALWPTTLGLPAFTWWLVVTRTLGVDLLLVALGVQAVLWSWLGKHEARSPYRVAATFGFAAFVMVTFWAKLEWRVLHAYAIPVGLALLVLLHTLRDHVPRATTNVLRAAIHLAMLGTTAWSALIDPRYPIAFHVTLLLASLASMAGGAFVRVRLYLVLGFTGVVVALASTAYRVLSSLDQGPRLTAIGFLVLLLGVLLVLGTVYSKTHRERVERWLARWRAFE
ncbi:MAG: hypothetical protein H6833_10840 [Planctomycetes bacterium]|nr:hypothetical protein [Planctomycetota bacterium]